MDSFGKLIMSPWSFTNVCWIGKNCHATEGMRDDILHEIYSGTKWKSFNWISTSSFISLCLFLRFSWVWEIEFMHNWLCKWTDWERIKMQIELIFFSLALIIASCSNCYVIYQNFQYDFNFYLKEKVLIDIKT